MRFPNLKGAHNKSLMRHLTRGPFLLAQKTGIASNAAELRCLALHMTLRQAIQSDIPAMQRVRLAVRENSLSDPTRITESDYIAALEDLGRTWVIEADGEIAAFAAAYRADRMLRPGSFPKC